MRVWLITVGEPLPMEEEADRLYRTGILAGQLIERGHEVVWWTSTMDHIRKKQRYGTDHVISPRAGYRIRLLHSIGYRRNIGLGRIVNHIGIARKFRRISRTETKPDIVLCSLPTLELSVAATQYGRAHGVPVLLDIRDLWPDLFLDFVPRGARLLAKWMLWPMFRAVRTACRDATALTGVTPRILEWGLEYARRPPGEWDRYFPHGYSETVPSQRALEKAEHFWETKGIRRNDGGFVACFFGTIGRNFELRTIIRAARQLAAEGKPIRFVLCGAGEDLERLRNWARGCDNVLIPGWVGAAEIWSLMRMSSVGLAPYRGTRNFQLSIPNKPIEYLSAGLPVVTCLQGTLRSLLDENHCGMNYPENDPGALANLLAELQASPDRLGRFSENARALYRREFVAEQVYAGFAAHLEAVAAAAPRHRFAGPGGP